MKKLMLGMACLLLLAIQVNAQEDPAPKPSKPSRRNAAPKASVSPPAPPSTYSYSSGSSSLAPSVSVSGNGNVAVQAGGSNYNYSYNSDAQDQDEPMKTKAFTKSFAVDKNDKISLYNQYGTITIKVWDKNEIKVDADIRAYANTDNEAQKLLDGVSIRASKDGDQVSYKTEMEEHNGNWGRGNNNGKKWRREVKIYLTVYMPRSNPLNVSQEYGSVVMDDYNGPTVLKVQYGSLIGGNLNNANNYISAAYSTVKFNDINQAKIRHEYGSGVTIGNINTIDIDAQYTTVNITNVKTSGNFRHEYGGGIKISNANNLNINSQYVRTNINTLTGNVVAKLEYGGFSVNNIEPSVKNFNLTSDYAAISLGFDVNYNANFNVSTDYCPFKYGTSVTAKKLGEEKGYSSFKSYKGQVGKGSATNNVSVKAEYGSVTFK